MDLLGNVLFWDIFYLQHPVEGMGTQVHPSAVQHTWGKWDFSKVNLGNSPNEIKHPRVATSVAPFTNMV